MIHAATAAITQAPKRFIHRRTTTTGPPSESSTQTPAATASQIQNDSTPKSGPLTRLAIRAIAQSSNAVHPTSWATFSAVGA